MHEPACTRLADRHRSRQVLNDMGLAIRKAGLRHEIADASRRQVASAVFNQRRRKVVVNPPFVLTRMGIESDRQQAATGAQYSPRFAEEGGWVVEMMKGIDAEHAAAEGAGIRQGLGSSAHK